MKRLSAYRFLILIAIWLMPGSAKLQAQGLRFHGNEKDISERSALTLPKPDSSFGPTATLSTSFSLRFDNISSPGFIFGIRNRNGNDMLSLMYRYVVPDDSAFITFAKEGERQLCSVGFKGSELRKRQIDVVINIDARHDNGSVTIDGNTFPVSGLGLSGMEFIPQLNFGLTRHIVETASLALSNLYVKIDNRTLAIPLNETEGNVVHDSHGNDVGETFNPIWLIHDAYRWQQIASFESSTPSGVAFDPALLRFYSYNADSLRVFDVTDRTFSQMPLKGVGKFPSRHGMNLFSQKTRRIIPYEIYYNDFSASINPETGEWVTLHRSEDDKAMHHHAHILSANDSVAYIFGGYGDRRYANSLVRFNLYNHRFDTIPLNGDIIEPRFFTSMFPSASGDTLYLYGGKGNPEGQQDLGLKYYYDFYEIDLKHATSKKLWTQSPPEKDRVPARTLIPSNDRQYFYAITYPEYIPHSKLQLHRISMADGRDTMVGDSIPIVSEEIATNVALHRPPGGDRIFCVVQEFGKEGNTFTRLYSISDPPVSADALKAYSSGKSGSRLPLSLIGGALLLLALMLLIFLRRRRSMRIAISASEAPCLTDSKPESTPFSTVSATPSSDIAPDSSRTSVPNLAEDSVTGLSSSTSDGPNPITTELSIDPASVSIEPSKPSPSVVAISCGASLPMPKTPMEWPGRNRIALFGNFLAIDSSCIDISHMFSPKLKQLFVYILLSTLAKGGVSAGELSAVFWADKEPDKIKNLRNVTIAKLRKILSEIAGVDLVYANSLFSISLSDGCYCDIARLYQLSDSLKSTHIPHTVPKTVRYEEDASKRRVASQNEPPICQSRSGNECYNLKVDPEVELMAIMERGKFLYGIDLPEFDRFKSPVENFEIDYINRVLSESVAAGVWREVIACCAIISRIDPLSEVALSNAIKAYMAIGRAARAHDLYDTFAKAYRKAYAQDFPKTFSSLL